MQPRTEIGLAEPEALPKAENCVGPFRDIRFFWHVVTYRAKYS